jgi:TPR repeat protein
MISAPAYASPDISLAASKNGLPSADFDAALSAYRAGDFDLALSSAKLAGTAGDTDAMVLAGTILMNGESGLINDKEAADWLRRAANLNNSDAQLALGKMALKSRGGLSPSDAMGFFSAASQAGRAEARRAIGEMYMKGIGIAPDPEKAKSWLTQAADAGDGAGAKAMGDSLFESDPKAALVWYEKAAAAGNNEAAYIAAIMYAENYEIRPNSAKAAILLRQAAESGIAGAQADYGLLVYQGAGAPRSIEGAAEWFKKSAMGGDAEGQFLYAFTLAKGEGVPQNFEDAYYWLLKSGQSGVDDYDLDRKKLRERLEANVDPNILTRARVRASQ